MAEQARPWDSITFREQVAARRRRVVVARAQARAHDAAYWAALAACAVQRRA